MHSHDGSRRLTLEDPSKPALKSPCVPDQTRLQIKSLSQNKECNVRTQQALRHSVLFFSFSSISTNPHSVCWRVLIQKYRTIGLTSWRDGSALAERIWAYFTNTLRSWISRCSSQSRITLSPRDQILSLLAEGCILPQALSLSSSNLPLGFLETRE